jgi:hypothetical protein
VGSSSRLSIMLSPSSMKMLLGISLDIPTISMKPSQLSHCSNNLLSVQTWDSLSSQYLPSASLLVVCMWKMQALAPILLFLLLFKVFVHSFDPLPCTLPSLRYITPIAHIQSSWLYVDCILVLLPSSLPSRRYSFKFPIVLYI